MSIVACPLGSDDQFLDVLYVVLPVEYGTGEWLALVQLASEEYRQAEMTWAAREQAESNAAIEHELEKGRQIQLRLVAKDVNIDGIDVGIGFQPCQWVGGDYVDAVATGDGRVFLTVADVCGKGLQAALITSSLHTMVHTNVMSGFELADMIRRLNHYLCQTLPDDSFVSMIAIVLDLATGEFQCVNAGHPPAILIGESAEPKHLQSGVNPPLGLDQVDYGIDNGKLDHDRVLAMYTDGLTEMRDAESGEMLGIEGVESCIRNLWSSNQSQPAQTIAESLTRFLDERRGRHFAADDQTFLLARLL
jgi:serine phosphatase RsbU (regulator of sigma subunit)